MIARIRSGVGRIFQPNGEAQDHVGRDELVESVLDRAARDAERLARARMSDARPSVLSKADQAMIEIVHILAFVDMSDIYDGSSNE